MKKLVKVLLGLFALIIAIAVIYWQFNKKKIVRDAVETAISTKTDSLYFIHYDSSRIDEVNGNARFFNVVLQSDSLQKQLLQFDTAEATQIYNIQVSEVVVEGANIPALLGNEKLHANLIRIIRPVIYVINSGSGNSDQLSKTDTLAIYEKLLGKFKSIEAGAIIIEDGQLYFTHKMEEPYVSISGIGITMKNVLIDSTKDYNNILSYFINDVNLTVQRSTIKSKADNSTQVLSGLEYSASRKLLKLDNFQQINEKSGTLNFNINELNIKGLNTDSFILKKQLKAEALVCEGGLLTFYTRKAKPGANDILEMDNNYFDEALLNKININKIKILVYNKDKPKEPPFILTNVKFSATGIQRIVSGTSIRNLIAGSNWNLSADGFSFLSSNKVYKLSIGAFNFNAEKGKLHINNFSVRPQMSDDAYMKSLKEQTDLYNISIDNIELSGIDTKKLIKDKMLIAKLATLQPVIKVSCDRTLPPYTGSKVGNYPHQLIQKIQFPILIKKVVVSKGYITYTERSSQSEQKGTLFFSNVNGTIQNVTNISSFINRNNMLTVHASAQLLGVSNLQTNWRLPLNSPNGSFYISGNAGSFSAEALNALIEPLALASVQSGIIRSVDFNMEGNDHGAKGSSILLYNDLKIEALKKDSNDLKKRDLASFFANLIIKNDNPMNGNTRKGEIDIERDATRSFFNLVWKGIFKAAKRTAIGKDDRD